MSEGMARYARRWRLLAIPLGLALALAGLVAAPPFATTFAILLAFMGAALTTTADHRGPVGEVDWGLTVRRGVAGTMLLLALLGATLVLPPPLASAVIVLGSLSAPPVVRFLRDRLVLTVPRLMSDAELALVWRETTRQVRASTSRNRTALARQRSAYLAEMERRNPAGLEAWLGSETVDGLERFVLPDRPEDEAGPSAEAAA